MRNQFLKTGLKVVLTLLAIFPAAVLFAQTKVVVKGTVADSLGIGLANATIRAIGTGQQVNADSSGHFQLSVPGKEILEFSSVGFKIIQLHMADYQPDAGGVVQLRAVLTRENAAMDEVVVVGFGTQRRKSMVSSVTSVNVEELRVPTGNITNALAGRVAGMISFQTSGEPGLGTDNSQFFIRGLSTFGTGKQDPLILIDGVESTPTDMARIQPDDISDFSVLKDAAASAVYGARGANGVVLINTKSGKSGATKFDLRSETRLSTNTRNFNFADNITYMRLANEATLTRSPNAREPYSVNKINHTIDGDDPYLYPNNNWIDMLIKKHTINQSYNLGLSGGTPKARYYVAGWYQINNGNLKVDPVNDFNNNIKLQSYSLRSNINLNLTATTELIVRLYGQFDDYKGPIGGGAATYKNAIWSNPVMFPAVYPASMLPYIEHPLFGSSRTYSSDGNLTNTLYVNPYAEMVKGYSVAKTSNLMPQLELKQNLKFITPGLAFRGMAYVRRTSDFFVNRSYNPFYYEPIVNPQDQTYRLKVLNDGTTGSVGTVGSETLGYAEAGKNVNSMIWAQGAFDYSQRFAKHDVGGMLISYVSSYETGNGGDVTASLPQRNTGISGRFTYGYDDRYMAEFNFGYNASERFAANSRWGFFPSAGVAYRVSSEKFFKPLLETVNALKFRFTYGLVGNDQIGNKNDRFFYLSNLNLNDPVFGASFGRNEGGGVYSRPGVAVYRYANNKISWERSKQINLGMDLSMFHALELTVDVFKQYRTNILMPRTYVENAAGFMATPISNYGKAESQGMDISLSFNKNLTSDFNINTRGTFTYATGKRTVVDELQYDQTMAYKSLVGQSLSQRWGLIAERLFVDNNEVANAPLQYGDAGLLAGDIKYRDVNGDGVINDDDMVPIGNPTVPEIIYGFGSSLRYKNIDFSFYFQGAARSSFFIDPQNIQPFFRNGGFENGLLSAISESHWSEDNPDLYAFWPRLSTWNVESNNKSSTWWMRKGNFLRLKSIDAGYTFNKLKRVKLNSARIYFAATNLALWSNFKMWDVEMGGNGLGYPIQSVYSLGVQVTF
ncbi:TonB-dependent receptor [Niabella sp. CC-SYL272]|uniref:SusC/RagA family TonB-linked outer membrane protein n=1 Tax=Niabella agricola TaxID=2891571 RepID=UPI001F43DA57|nr:TonB-dependent receptor [Niabella agricola]MCF3111770.1 TonB-dependent receptor [Niabella agricola]